MDWVVLLVALAVEVALSLPLWARADRRRNHDDGRILDAWRSAGQL